MHIYDDIIHGLGVQKAFSVEFSFRGRVDPDTWNHVERIGKESENFLLQLTSPYRPSDKDFPRIIYNNRSVFGVWRNEGMFLEICWKGVSLVDFF